MWWAAVGLALRLAWALYAAREPYGFFGGDQTGYLNAARSIADGDGYRMWHTNVRTAFWPPGYPMLLAAGALLVERLPVPGNLPAWAAAGQAVAGAVMVVAAWWLARAATGSERAGVIAAALVALWPNLVLHVATFHLETVYMAVTLVALVLLARGNLVSGGLVLGFAVLIRPFALPVVVLVGIAWLLAGRTRREALRAVAVVGGIVLAVQVPWVVRNAVQMDAFVPSSTNFGDTLCVDHRDEGNGGFAFVEECFGGGEVAQNRRNVGNAVEWVVENPFEELSRWPLRARELLEHDHDAIEAVESYGAAPFLSSSVRRTLEIVSDVWFFVIAPVGVAGAAWLVMRRRDRPATVLVVGLAASMLLIVLNLYGLPRFHVPLLPLLAISASPVIDAVLPRSSTRAPRGTALPAP